MNSESRKYALAAHDDNFAVLSRAIKECPATVEELEAKSVKIQLELDRARGSSADPAAVLPSLLT